MISQSPSPCAALIGIVGVCVALGIGTSLPAWSAQIDKESPVGAVGGAVHADPFTGTATTSIPIEVPPGRGGVQPALNLVYNSTNGNDWVGQGWKLEKGVIERQIRFGVNYSGDEYVFRLSGINVELVNVGSGEYRAEVEGGFTRIKKLTAADGKPYFEATDKSGTKFTFGKVAGTRVADPANANNIFRWCLERVEDTHGNYMTLSYTGDQGQGYLSQIDYTGNGAIAPTNTIKFYLETRTDAPAMYVPNFLMKTAKRLKTIEVKANGTKIRAYKLSYSTSGTASPSRLTGVQQYGKDVTIDGTGTITGGTALPTSSYGYTTIPNDFQIWSWNSGVFQGNYEMIPGDFNGDGKTDVYLHARDSTSLPDYMGLSTGSGFTSWTWSSGGVWNNYEVHPGDFNGDGKTDIYLHARPGVGGVFDYMGLSTGTGFSLWTWNSGGNWNLYHVVTGDFNGDGKADLYLHERPGTNVGERMGLSNGTGFSLWTWSWSTGWGGYSVIPADFNGDGKTDIYLHGNPGTGNFDYMGLSTGTGFNSNPWTWTSTGNWTTYEALHADYNGDGKADLYLHVQPGNTSGMDYMGLSTGNGFLGSSTSTPWTWSSGGNWEGYDVEIGDFNGDGKIDLYLHGRPNTTVGEQIGYSTGDGFSLGVWSWGAGWAGGLIVPGDYNGDGKADIYFHAGPLMTSFNDYLGLGNGNGVPHLLQTVNNGVGGTATINYVPSTLYTNTQLPYPIQTVNFTKTNDGNGHEAVTYYDYNGGFHHIGERDFRGFNFVKVTGQAGANGEKTITETWFHQGNDTAVDVNNPNVANGYLKGSPYRSKVKDGAGNLYSESTTTYQADDNGLAPFFTPPSSVVNTTCDGTSCGKQTRTDFTYDSYGNVTREDQYGDTGTSTDDRTVTRTYSPNTTAWILGLPATEKIYQGLGTSVQVAGTDFYYDGTTSCGTASTNQQPTKGDLTRVVKWLSGGTSPETRMAYDAYGNVTCTRDPRGNTSTVTYDSSKTFALSTTNALGHVISTSYYGVNGVAMTTGLYGQVKTVTDPNGAVSTSEYDVFGRNTKVTQPNGAWTTTAYNSFGTVGTQHIYSTSSLSLSTWTYFDGLHRTIKTRSTGPDSKIAVAQVQYDNRGAVTQQSLPVFEPATPTQWTSFLYDAVGRTIRATNPDASRGLSCVDDWVTVSIDANNHRSRTVRDAYGRVLTVQEYTGTYTTCDTSVGSPYATTTYTYDVLGNLKTVTDAKGNISTMTYDTLSRKTAMHDPDMGNWSYLYDAAGNLTRQTDAKNQNIYFQYDALNRRQQKDYGSQKTLGLGDVNYVYDGTTDFRKGRLQKVLDGAGITTFYYNNMGEVIRTDKAVSGVTYTTQTTYDGLGRVLNLTYPDLSVITHTYNGPQLWQVKEGATIYAAYTGFNAQGQPSTLTLGNGAATTYTYDPNNYRLKTLKTVKGAITLQDLTYTFDTGGNVTTLVDPVPGHGNQTFVYDGLDRLTSATGPYGTVTNTYDQIGNMLTNSRLSPSTYTYPASGSSSVRPHAVSTAGGNTYTYDANGNMTGGAGRTITYDYENRPVSVTKSGTTTTFVYDGDGGRVKKIVGTTTTTYIGKLYVCVGTSCAKMIFSGGQRIAIKQVSSGSTSYFHPDHLGSTSVLTNSSGVKEQDLVYYPYGETFTNTGTANVAYKYTGKELDDSTGLYFYEARYYDAVLGRFISADTIVPNPGNPQDFNRYTYANNNPIIFNDPSGHFSLKKTWKKVKNSVKKLNVAKVAFKYATWGMAFPVMDAILKTSPYVQMGVGVVVSIYAGPVGSAWYSAYTTQLNGGKINDMAKAGGISFGTSYAFQGVDSLAGGNHLLAIGGHGLVGGTSAKLQGGSFKYGFATAAGARTLMAGWDLAKEWTNSHTPAANTTNCGMGPCTDGTKGILGEKLAKGNSILEWFANAGQAGEYSLSSNGQIIRGDHYYNGLPGIDSLVQATSKVHDWFIGGALGRYTANGLYIPFGNVGAEAAFNVVGNFGTMIPAAAYTAAAFTSGTQSVVDVSRRIK